MTLVLAAMQSSGFYIRRYFDDVVVVVVVCFFVSFFDALFEFVFRLPYLFADFPESAKMVDM